MLLTRVILQDYGVYRGRNEFDLSCTEERPIILIGGTNGAGKTTLFESIMLCFYGIASLGKRASKKAYHDLLAKKIHRYAGSATPADSASIMVQFKFFHDNREEEYQVNRSWRNEEGRVVENLAIKKRLDDDRFQTLDLIEQSHWQSFLREMIPRGIAQLFFFDGERVSEIAETGSEDVVIKSSFTSLLGLSLVEQLQSDLQTNLMRNLAPNDAVLQQEIAKYEKQQIESTSLIDRLKEKVARKEADIYHTRSEIESLEDKISGIGGRFATKREELQTSLDSDVKIRDSIEKQIREMCGLILPLSTTPGYMHDLQEQILSDLKLQKIRLGEEIAESRLDKARMGIMRESFWRGLDISDDIKKRIQDSMLSMLTSDARPAARDIVFGYSDAQARRILDIVEQAGDCILSDLEEKTLCLVEAGERITRTQAALSHAPADDELGPILSRLNELNRTLGGLQAELDHLHSEIASNESMLRHLAVKMRSLISQRYKNSKLKTRADLTEKIQAVLAEYAASLKAKKLTLLGRYVSDAAKTLMHKKDFIERVTINKDTFGVMLFGRDGEQILPDMLSTGEKQMLATAILWALAKTSGRPLPFVIDTPLARLDEAHRDSLVEKFFPLASHQVLVFSTDTEIDSEYYKKLEPYTSRSYTMEFVQGSGRTRLRPGYFWNKEGDRVVASQ